MGEVSGRGRGATEPTDVKSGAAVARSQWWTGSAPRQFLWRVCLWKQHVAPSLLRVYARISAAAAHGLHMADGLSDMSSQDEDCSRGSGGFPTRIWGQLFVLPPKSPHDDCMTGFTANATARNIRQ